MAPDPRGFAARGQRVALRAVARGGRLIRDDERRRSVARVVGRVARRSVEAERAIGRRFERRSAPTTARATGPRLGTTFDLTPSDDQEMLRAAAADLAREMIRPAAQLGDRERAVPDKVRRAAYDMGLGLIGVPTALGGVAEHGTAVAGALVLEELAHGDLGVAVALLASGSVATALAAYGDGDQQATYLPALVEGAPLAAALALHEPQPLFDPAAPRATATTSGGDLVLSGAKALVPLARTAELFVVSVCLDGEPRLVVLEAAEAGVRVEDDPAMGLRAAGTGRVLLDEVRVPRTQLLGDAAAHRDAVHRSRVAWAALACGTGRAALDQLIPYVTQRQAFGEPIAHRQAVAFAVADIGLEVDGLRLATWRAAARLDAGRDAAREVAIARTLTARYAAQVGSQAVQLLGGHGFVKDHDNERWYRDLRGAGIVEGGVLV